MQPTVELYQHPSPLFVESFDDIIIEFTTRAQANTAQILAFCGSDPGVGTTTVAINLAISLSLAQWKTLLIDGDMRKHGAHKRLSSGDRQGLSDYLQSLAPLKDILCRTNHPNLHYLPCGGPVDYPLRLMGSKNFQLLMDQLTPHYNFILVDSPSIAAANDFTAVAHVADRVFAVAEPNRSTRENLANIREALGAEAGKMGGVIVNKVNDRDYRGYRMNYDYFNKEQYLTRKSRRKLRTEAPTAARRHGPPAQQPGGQDVGQAQEGEDPA